MRPKRSERTRAAGAPSRSGGRPSGGGPGTPVVVLLALAVACTSSGSGEEPAPFQDRTAVSGAVPGPGTAWIVLEGDTIRAEVARTPEERSAGLMFRNDVPAGTGMLFVFPDTQPRSFWMQNTLVPLDIAFLDAELRIVDIQQMEAESEDLTDSRAPAMFALEVPLGWLAEHDWKVGDRLEVVFGG